MIAGYRAVVVLDAEDARFLCEAFDRLAVIAEQRGARLTPPLMLAIDELRCAALNASESPYGASVMASNVSRSVRTIGPQRVTGDSGGHEIDSREAAKDLGCTPANVRDLARRRKLPARRDGGRWLFDAAAVAERANRYRQIPWE